MKVLILAGGHGTRISEESSIIPKPMIEIGGRPILWHIMKHYSFYGYNDFVILCGYKGQVIKDYFSNYFFRQSSVTFNLKENSLEVVDSSRVEPWKVTCLDTGLNTNTASRVKKAQKIVGDETFLLTYGDAVSNVPIDQLIHAHNLSGKIATVTATQLNGRFGRVEIDSNYNVSSFAEKPVGGLGWINCGYFVCHPKVFDFISENDEVSLEYGPLAEIAAKGEMHAFKHEQFWRCMDTLADKNALNEIWNKGSPPWKIWSETI